MCLALTKLLDTDQDFILISLQSLMTIWTDVITELREDDADATGDSLVYSGNGEADQVHLPEAPEDARRRELTYSDAVHTASLPEYIKQHLERAVEAAGGSQRFQEEWLVNVDRDVFDAFSKLNVM